MVSEHRSKLPWIDTVVEEERGFMSMESREGTFEGFALCAWWRERGQDDLYFQVRRKDGRRRKQGDWRESNLSSSSTREESRMFTVKSGNSDQFSGKVESWLWSEWYKSFEDYCRTAYGRLCMVVEMAKFFISWWRALLLCFGWKFI